MKSLTELSNLNVEEVIREGRISLSIEDYIKNSDALNDRSHYGTIQSSIHNTSDFIVTSWESIFSNDMKIHMDINDAQFALNFILKGGMEYTLSSERKVLKQGTNDLWSIAPREKAITRFRSKESCSSFGVIVKEKKLKHLVDKYPHLFERWYDRHINGETFNYENNGGCLDGSLLEVINQINNAHVMGDLQDFYLEGKVLELFALFLKPKIGNQASSSLSSSVKKRDVECLHEARNILINNHQQPPSIQELSSCVGLNEKKLKTGFKQLFNATIYGFLFDYKMDMAKRLLFDPEMHINEIAQECGYSYASHFTTAFRRKYGIAPKDFRKTFIL